MLTVCADTVELVSRGKQKLLKTEEIKIMSIVNLKLVVETKLQIELEAWLKCENKWNVSNQFDEIVLESALENFDEAFDSLVEKWQKEGLTMQAIGVMDWAHCLSEFEPPEIDETLVD